VTIRKGVQVTVPLFILNRDAEIWERPNEFIPERFEGKAENFTSAKQVKTCFYIATRSSVSLFLEHDAFL
jgi:cytochrome P450